MPDLLGPGAFGAAGAAASRPAYTPTNGAGDPDTWYQDCSSPTADDGTEWRAAALNAMLVQMRELARKSGVTLSNLDDTLIAKAIQSGGMNYAIATGTANAWVVAPSLAVPAYAAGRVIWVKAPATNSATTVTVNISSLGARSIKKRDGTDPQIGDLVSGSIYALVDDGTSLLLATPLPSEMLAASFKRSRVTFTATGAFTWTVPAGVTRILIKAWGGGGGGGAANTPSGAAGGGGGSYGEQAIDVTPGQSVTGSVGTAGVAGVTGGGAAPTAGGNTTVTYNAITYTAGGGSAGANIGAGAGVGNSANGGNTTNFTDVARSGTPSKGGLQGYSGSGTLYYGGAGGDAPNGGLGGNSGTGTANAGAAPGGGGGGSAANGANTNGAAGGRGEVWIEY